MSTVPDNNSKTNSRVFSSQQKTMATKNNLDEKYMK